MKQNALGRINSEPLEQLGVAQRKLDHLAQRVDRIAHPAQIVISDVGAPFAVLLGIFGKQFDHGLAVDVDDALGDGRDDHQPKLLKRERGCVEHLAHGVGHVRVDPLVAGSSDDVVLGQRPARESALQGFARALQPDVGLGRREHHAGGRLGRRLAHLDVIGRPDPGIGTLEPVEADDVDPSSSP